MNPKEKTKKVCQPKCHYYLMFCEEVKNVQSMTSVTLDGRPNNLILASPCLNFLFQRQRVKSVQTVEAWQISSQVEKQRCSIAKSELLEEIRADFNRRVVKRKEESKGLLVQMHPIKRIKMLGVLGWVGSWMLQKQVHEQFCLFCDLSHDYHRYHGKMAAKQLEHD